MAESTTIARPYAQAVFGVARTNNSLAAWTDMLDTAAAVVGHQEMVLLLGSPRLAAQERADLVSRVCGDYLNDQGRNLIRVLADNDRLTLLPQIAELYRDLRADEERTLAARLVSAREVDSDMHERLVQAMSQRLGRTVTLATEHDERLIGGAVIHAGDLVIDGSVRGRLQRLASALRR